MVLHSICVCVSVYASQNTRPNQLAGQNPFLCPNVDRWILGRFWIQCLFLARAELLEDGVS